MNASELLKGKETTNDPIRVLIADDDPPTRILLRAAISQWGYEVTEASNGEEAWQILLQPNAPRLLILDWLMPRLDGISLCERIKKEQIVHPYTILLTQVTGTTNIIKGLEAGADEFLSKPFNMAELRSRLSVGARIIRFENKLAEQNTKVENYSNQMESLSQAHAKLLVYHSDLLKLLGSLIEKIAQTLCDSFSKITSLNPDSEELKKIEELRTSLTYVIQLIKHLQNNTGKNTKSGVCDLNKIIQEALQASQSAIYSLKPELELATNLPLISADEEQLQEVIVGLLLSALDAIKDQKNPFLKISTQLLATKSLQIQFIDSGTATVEAENDLPSRLCISMSKEIIQKYRGTLSFENRAEQGSCVSINLPLEIKNTERAG